MSPTPRALEAFSDNYVWLLAGPAGGCVLVDPGDAAPVLREVEAGLRVDGILLTHHHADHVGGVEAVQARCGCPAWGPDDPRMPAGMRRVAGGEAVEVAGLRFRALAVPGHTRSHLAWHGAGVLFCGDTLFSLGCGRLFEGTPAQMLASLDALAALPADTLACPAHEYTAANARFARTVDPGNPALRARAEAVEALRAAGRPTLPVRLGDERAANPFLRVDDAAVAARVRAHAGLPGDADRVAVFAALRAWKDGFTA